MKAERWPIPGEVRQHYLSEGFAYALITGFRDYRPVVACFYIVADSKVYVDFPHGPKITDVKDLEWHDKIKIEFLTRHET